MTIGERIKNIRKKSGMSQVAFADKIDVSKQTLYKYENDIITNIPSDKIEKVAELGNVSPAYLMGWDEPFGNHLKDRREELNLSYEDIVQYLGVTTELVYNWESGLTDSLINNKEYVVLLSNILKVSPLYVLGIDAPLDVAQNPNAIEFYLDSNSTSKNSYSPNEILLIKKYRDLDDHGKKVIDFTLQEELERVQEMKYYRSYADVIEIYELLNKTGKIKALDYMNELGGNSQYNKNITSDADIDSAEKLLTAVFPSENQPKAAHNDHMAEPGKSEKVQKYLSILKKPD